jgi:hypothetical protein
VGIKEADIIREAEIKIKEMDKNIPVDKVKTEDDIFHDCLGVIGVKKAGSDQDK